MPSHLIRDGIVHSYTGINNYCLSIFKKNAAAVMHVAIISGISAVDHCCILYAGIIVRLMAADNTVEDGILIIAPKVGFSPQIGTPISRAGYPEQQEEGISVTWYYF